MQGSPSGATARTESGVLDRMSSGTVAPPAVAASGLAAIAAVLGVAVRHRRRTLEVELSVPLARLEPAQDR